ncbi:MAG: helix-turn-helix transcriptional regulator [Alphaproteobacteria bacterium]|nr:helix-turn-helix transcriptional regulator [Alphaproteobacteria bacterium]
MCATPGSGSSRRRWRPRGCIGRCARCPSRPRRAPTRCWCFVDPDRLSAHLSRNLRLLREARGLTQQELAQASGVPRPTLARLECGSPNPTLSVMARVAGALGVTLEELVSPPKTFGRHYRVDELPIRHRPGVALRAVVPDAVPGLTVERMAFAPGARLTGAPHSPGTREYLICETGQLALRTAADRWVLEPGDVIVYRGDQPHAYTNVGKGEAVAYTIVVPGAVGVPV